MTTAERLNLLHRVAGAEALPVNVESMLAEPSTSSTSGEGPAKTGVADLVELILKRRDRLEQMIREPSLQSLLLPKFLAISLIGFVFFGVALSLVFTSAGQWPRLAAIRDIVAGEAAAVAS